MTTATYIRQVEGFQGDARLYEISEEISEGVNHVIVSAITSAFDTAGPETYIFPSDGDGNVLDWGELNGSFRGGTDHAKAIRDAGWELVS